MYLEGDKASAEAVTYVGHFCLSATELLIVVEKQSEHNTGSDDKRSDLLAIIECPKLLLESANVKTMEKFNLICRLFDSCMYILKRE